MINFKSLSKRLLVLSLLLLLLFMLVPLTAAQETESQPAIQQMRVQILPEYDDPRVLVILQGRLDAPDGSYNGPVTFRIPSSAQINQMAVMDLELQGPRALPYETQIDPTDSSWQLVTYTLTNPHFFYEYYDVSPGTGSQKQFTFTLKSPVDVEVLSVEIQQPLKADNFSVEPETVVTRSDPSGFTYWQMPERSAGADEAVEYLVRYTKSDPNPSIVRETAVLESASETAPATTNDPNAPPLSWIGLTVIGAAFIIGAGFIRYRIRANKDESIIEAQPTTEPMDVGMTAVQPRFCTHCGQPLPPKARFCPYCGEGVRR